jgi:hypothetical protein
MSQDTPQPVASTVAATTELRYFAPGEVRFARRAGRLDMEVANEATHLGVIVARAFPMTNPRRHISVSDRDRKELGLIRALTELDTDSHHLVEAELARRYLLPTITAVYRVNERFGTLDWHVLTSHGERRFTTRHLRDNLAVPSPGRYLLTDVDGNRYDIPDIAALPPESQAIVVAYL